VAWKVMHIQGQIRNYIVENFLFGSNTLEDEDSFLEHGVVDSTGVLELVLFAEETVTRKLDCFCEIDTRTLGEL